MVLAYAPDLWRVVGINLLDIERLTWRQLVSLLATVAHVRAEEQREARRG
jgi:hypothetical protein